MINIPAEAKTVEWPVDIGFGYNFKANEPIKLKRMGNLVMIFHPDEIILNNGEVTEDILKQAIFK